MNIEDLDDPRARELKKAAVKVANAGLSLRQIQGVMPALPRRELDAGISIAHDRRNKYESALDAYQERLILGGWRNEGE